MTAGNRPAPGHRTVPRSMKFSIKTVSYTSSGSDSRCGHSQEGIYEKTDITGTDAHRIMDSSGNGGTDRTLLCNGSRRT